MKIEAAVARSKFGSLTLEALELEEPRDDEVRVRMVATGVCHTDVAVRDGTIVPMPQPMVLGHEGAGIVEKVGKSVVKVKVGDRVILSGDSCGHCPSCQDSLPCYCYEFFPRNFGGGRLDGTTPLSRSGEKVHTFMGQGSFASHAVCHDRNVVKVRDNAPLELLGPLGCGVITGAGGVINSLKVGVGKSIAVFGTGSVGLSAIMAAKLIGAGKIIAIDVRDERLDLARELGATHCINATKQSVPEAISAICSGGVDFTFETTASMSVLRQAIDVLALRGTCGFVGGAPEDSELTFVTSHVMNGGRTIRGIILGDTNPDEFLPKLIELQALGRFPIEKLITFYKFKDVNQAIEDSLAGRCVKPVLLF
ncbi:NAD(P)-dependent alcohol dehydrogenase [Bradyrhizobium sp. Ec3.3]|uniref:NAD(P)-dependent alcohol dehydrogenase n=1 Tax=Bradyrhizobium sp. Ec3.3 TaxID=189753 RepID=UPI00040D4226|nr:NAD(P)-dependent alcohol dehydrogenase [Bradyrhizobium sp. Ec3.3]